MTETFTCPRRRADGMHKPGAFLGSGENLDTYTWKAGLSGQALGCSYCGSMPPDEFMLAVADHEEIGPTDKGYKLYVGEHMRAKFYTHHLSPEQGDEFIRLWKERKINWGYPGYPYVRLYIPGEES